MKRLLGAALLLAGIFSCTPVDKPEPDMPEQGNGTTPWEDIEFAVQVKVTYSGNSATVTSSDDSIIKHISGADVALDLTGSGETEVIATGASEDGQLKIYGDSDVKLVLNGLNLTSAKSAAINVQNKSTLYVHLGEGTENIIGDAKKQSDESYYQEGSTADDEKRNGVLYCKGSVVFSGTGMLEMTGRKKHGISVKSSVTVEPGVRIKINDVADNCVKAEGITILGGHIWANTSADAGKCLSSDADVTIEDGILELFTSGGSVYEEDENDTSSPAGIKADGNIVISGGEILCESTGDGGKGLNADGGLTIDGGKIDIMTSGGKYIYNSALDLDSSPKGVKADGEIVINGGILNIQVKGKSDGSEGLESKSKITINDGEVSVTAYDDAVNVGGDYPTGIEINGGKLYAFSEHNDGIDSNGKLWVKGGLAIASGSAVPEEGFDCDRSQNFIVTGGTLIGTGGAAIGTSTSSTQRAVIYNGVNVSAGDLFVIADQDGNPILKYEMPRTIRGMAVFFSSADIKSGATYNVFTGGILDENTTGWNGWLEDGTYIAGTKIGSFTSSSLTTTVGQSSGGPGGPPPGGPR